MKNSRTQQPQGHRVRLFLCWQRHITFAENNVSLSSWRYHSPAKSNLCPSKSASVMCSNFAIVLFANRRISVSISDRAASIRAIVQRRSEVWYIQIKFSSSTLKFMVRPPIPLPFPVAVFVCSAPFLRHPAVPGWKAFSAWLCGTSWLLVPFPRP